MRQKFSLLITFTLSAIISSQESSTEKLIYVQALWRHGDRAPNKLPYPNDIYNETTWPRGWSQLTNIGMLQLYELGQFFQQRYRSFVKYFDPDDLLRPTDFSCPLYDRRIEEQNEELYKNISEKYANFFSYLVNVTGYKKVDFKKAASLYNVQRELYHNFTQPRWLYKRWPEFGDQTTLMIINELKRISRISEFNTLEKARLRGGLLMGNWIDRMRNVSQGIPVKPRKMQLYSAHDGTVLALMYALGVGNDQLVPYAACLIMELYLSGNSTTAKACSLDDDGSSAGGLFSASFIAVSSLTLLLLFV